MRDEYPAKVRDERLNEGIACTAKGCWLPAAHVVGNFELPGLGGQAAKAGMWEGIIGLAGLDGKERGPATDPEVRQLGKPTQAGLNAADIVLGRGQGRGGRGAGSAHAAR